MKPAALDLAEGFALHAVGWAQRHTDDARTLALIRHAARTLSLATAQGHVCLPLAAVDAREMETALRTRLLASGVVATPDALTPAPLTLDAQNRLYLSRYYRYECRLAAALGRLAPPRPPAAEQIATLRATLDRLFAANATRLGERPDWQKLAAALALRSGLTIISGGPGTGKTYTVAALLACLLSADPALRIQLAAPTGKAAARMLESLQARSVQLDATLAARLPQEAATVHRLLGAGAQAGFRHHADNPLALDVLVVDEASMLDLSLATHLFEAVPSGARVLLLGDKDQLAAVEAGAVFAEVSASAARSAACAHDLAALTGIPLGRFAPEHLQAPRQATLPFDTPAAAPLADCTLWLVESLRFTADSGIGRLAAAIRAGDGATALAALTEAQDASLDWIDDGGGSLGAPVLDALDAGYADYLAALTQPEPATLFAAFARFRVLCAVHGGPRGTEAVNAAMAHRLRRRAGASVLTEWYPGRAVIVLRNDYDARLFNGDIGLCLPNAEGHAKVYFPDPAGGYRALAPARLPEHADAYALSVHKAQGSEFDTVFLLLPETAGGVLTRELVYTGVTRALRRVQVAGTRSVFEAACAQATVRHSGLAAQLAAYVRLPK